jgi:hypothetical protein
LARCTKVSPSIKGESGYRLYKSYRAAAMAGLLLRIGMVAAVGDSSLCRACKARLAA